ncbi:MAG: TolC family protein [Thermodesulfobacteriota bacterium]
MKTKLSLIFIIFFTYTSSVFGNNDNRYESLEKYQPPLYFTESLNFKERENNLYSKPDNDLSSLAATIEKLKINHENSIKKERGIEFLSDYDNKLFKHLVTISNNTDAVKKLVKNRFSLEEIEILAALRNPAILAAQKKVRAELSSFSQVMDLDENLRQYSAFTKELDNNAGPLKMNDSIQSKYPYPGVTTLKGQVINDQVSILVEKMEIIQKNIITDIRLSFWNLVYIDKAFEVTSETIDAFNRLKDVATTLYKSGKTSFQDVIKININTIRLREDLVTLVSKRKNIEIKIMELLNLSADTPLGRPAKENIHKKTGLPKDLYLVAMQQRQELKVIRLSIEKTQKMIEMAETMVLLPFTLNFSFYEANAVASAGTEAGGKTFPEKTMASMKNKYPVKPLYGINDPWLRETKLKLSSLKQTLIKEENKTNTMIREKWFSMDKNKRELQLYKSKIQPLAKSALDVSTRAYEADSIPFAEAIDSYTYWLKVKLTIAKKQTALGISMAKLEKTIGISF